MAAQVQLTATQNSVPAPSPLQYVTERPATGTVTVVTSQI